MKENGSFANAKWFCSEVCLNLDPQILRIKQMQEKIKSGPKDLEEVKGEESDDIEIDL